MIVSENLMASCPLRPGAAQIQLRDVHWRGRAVERAAFSRRRNTSSKLYLIELLKFIEYSGQYTDANVFHTSIAESVAIVNTHRIDAHAKAITEQEYARLSRALDVLEAIFVQPD